MDLTAAQACLARVRYRPGWTFTLYQGDFEGPHLRIRADVENSYRPGQTVALDIHSPVPLAVIADGPALLRYLAWRLQIVESHEMREWLKLDGVVVFDPHAPDVNRDLPGLDEETP